jgi:uncharacterized membrane protein YdfJ with MMPL/SSD domain
MGCRLRHSAAVACDGTRCPRTVGVSSRTAHVGRESALRVRRVHTNIIIMKIIIVIIIMILLIVLFAVYIIHVVSAGHTHIYIYIYIYMCEPSVRLLF